MGKKLKILVLGGTQFVGPAIVNEAIGRGHRLTLFNRGITNPELFDQLPHIDPGDREKGLEGYQSLKKKKWDVVIDVWPERSQLVEEASQYLRSLASHYIFVSSIAVYRDFNEVGLHEGSSVVSLPKNKEEWYYPEEKVAAEKIIQERFPDNHTIVRPGPIKGWRDPANDLAYWLIKLKRGEEVIGPGSGSDPIQFIDVKDLGRFIIHAAEEKVRGTYNITGPQENPLLWRDFLQKCKEITGNKGKVTWLSEDFLRQQKVRSFEDLPLWAPLSEDRGFMQISNEKGVAKGLTFRSLEETFQDVTTWFEQNQNEDYRFGGKYGSTGLEREREIRLLERWKNKD